MSDDKSLKPADSVIHAGHVDPKACKPIGRGWDRDQVTVKMTARRKALMSDIALGMAAGTTPSDVVERALESAWNSARDSDAMERRIESLEDTVAAADHERRRESDQALAAIKDMAGSLARLHRLIRDLALDPAGDDSRF